MPELPEVEVVRRGLADHIVGHTVSSALVLHPRAVRDHPGGEAEFAGLITGRRISAVQRRGKFLWLIAETADGADPMGVVVHLGMSGQVLFPESDAVPHKHLRLRLDLDDGRHLAFIDQRTFGRWRSEDLVTDPTGRLVPESVAHIAPDPFEESFDAQAVARVMRTKSTEIKRLLLDQTVVSGVGNIYADEALWRAKLHGTRNTGTLTLTRLREVLGHARDVMTEALAQGGTSFDALYVNVNGESGYFSRSLDAYGRAGESCHRCGTPIVREQFMNRSSHFCPMCQRPSR